MYFINVLFQVITNLKSDKSCYCSMDDSEKSKQTPAPSPQKKSIG